MEIQLPTSSSIAAAKQKRQLLRKTGGEIGDDYISLSVTKRVDQGPHPESRLVREEDELGEADDGPCCCVCPSHALNHGIH